MNRQANPLTTAKIVWPAFTAVILIAFFFRFYRLGDHPLGIFFDPAINGLDAIRLMQRGGPVIFFPTNGGREALFMYLLIPFIWLFDTTPLSIRALTATISLLNVALLFAFLYRLPLRNATRLTPHATRNTQHITLKPWLAILGSLALAVSYWHIAISRLGQRPILVPMLSVPLFWFFLKGWATGQKRWFILAGLFMGLEGYTYSAARLLPLILILALLPEFLPRLKKGELKSQLINLLIFILTALVIYLPMAWYLVRHPGQFTARSFSVMVWNFLDTPADIVTEIGRNTLRVAGFFCCTGSPNPIFGLPDYPGLSLLLTPCLLIGLFGALKNWRHLFDRLVALWWLIGLIPSIIAIEAPHLLRMIVAVVPTAILIALGPIYLTNWLISRHTLPEAHRHRQASTRHATRDTQHATRNTQHAWPLWLSLLLILIPTPGIFRAYFIDWTDLQTTRGIYDYGAIAIRDKILQHTDQDVPIYLPLDRFNDSTLLFYLSGSFQRQAMLSSPPANKALVISPEKNKDDPTWVRLQHHTATVLPPLTPAGQQLIQAAWTSDATDSIRTADGEVVAHLVQLPTDLTSFLQQPTTPLTASFGPARLTGTNYAWVIEPTTGEIPVTLYWQATGQMSDEYEVLLHLVDDQHRVWGNGDGRPNDWAYPTTFWRPGLDDIAAQYKVVIEAETLPPGRYWLALSLFHPATGQRLALTAGASDSPDTFFIGPLKVPLPPSPPSLTGNDRDEPLATFGNLAKLAGFAVDQSTVAAGEPVHLTLVWEALTRPEIDYTVFVHLLDPNDNMVAGQDTQPVHGGYPTTIWSAEERILDNHSLPIPNALSPGQYRLAIGLYHQATGQRLLLYFPNGDEDPQGRLILPQPITVTSN